MNIQEIAGVSNYLMRIFFEKKTCWIKTWLNNAISKLPNEQKVVALALAEGERDGRIILERLHAEGLEYNGSIEVLKADTEIALSRDFGKNHTSYTFFKVEKNQFNDKLDTDPEALYVYTLCVTGQTWSCTCGIELEKLQPLLTYFAVTKPSELTGKNFWVPAEYDDHTSALDYFIKLVISGETYTQPDHASLHEQAKKELAKIECPNFEAVDDQTVFAAFRALYDQLREPEAFDAWRDSIFWLSGKEVTIEEASPDVFPWRIKGPAMYLKLVSEKKTQLFTFGPYSTPFNFVSTN